jgi:HAE1 family hydrophobic/amphiphilic exporter-1/multidrug efflux pump
MEEVAAANLPSGFGYEWTGTAFQEKKAGGEQAIILGLAFVFVFLVLAAQYESWTIPFGVLLGIPLGILGALLGVLARGFINDVYVQIGLVVLVGLAAKNAILIVEFSKMRREQGCSPEEAALEASELRFRPIMMTAVSFIIGVLPLVLAAGAGAASRQSLGTAVFSGMFVATLLGVLIIPVLYVVIEKFLGIFKGKPSLQTMEEIPVPEQEVEG